MRSIAILALLCSPAVADHCRQQVVIQHADTGFIAVPYAVAIPVATVAVGQPLYSLNQQAYPAQTPQAAPAASAPQTSDETAKLFGEFLAWREAQQKAAAAPVSLVTKYCSTCHGASSDKANARQGMMLEALTPDERISAVKQIRANLMPPSATKNPLPAAEKEALIDEFLAAETGKTEWKKTKPQSLPKAEVPPEPKKE